MLDRRSLAVNRRCWWGWRKGQELFLLWVGEAVIVLCGSDVAGSCIDRGCTPHHVRLCVKVGIVAVGSG